MTPVSEERSNEAAEAQGGSESRQMLAVITGVIHPGRLGWTLQDPVDFEFYGAKCTLFVRRAVFNMFIEGDRPEDLPTFLNHVHSIIQGALDSLGFFMAAPLRGEILSMVVDGVELHHRDLQWELLLPEGSDKTRVEGVHLQPFMNLALGESAVRLALADLRSAIDSPGETVMLCFRAIESIRHWYLDGKADSDAARNRSWKALRAELDIDREEIKPLEYLATARRHGAEPFATEQQRLDAVLLARKVVQRFVTKRVSAAPEDTADVE
ncbi:hypothetical protein ACIA49_09525 [Kribbella sp. NPDC051587]|uniref:hypothetical protein n=1 Tax=Kribbella sp. NPDC051587 TaxID=3364119 RepID=UPI0037AF6292